MARKKWTRRETLAALNLYLRTPFGRLHARNREIVFLARCLGRTPSAVAMKCCNLAALDPVLKARGIKGLRGVSDLDRSVWNGFHTQPEAVGYESEIAFARLAKQTPRMAPLAHPMHIVERTDRKALTVVRITQHLFRATVLAGYAERCAICTLSAPELLVASHIVAWSIDKANRMNPCNGICLCAIHDRAFDAAMIDIDESYVVHITSRCSLDRSHRAASEMLYRFDGTALSLPSRWHPDPELLRRRRELLLLA